jgi:thiol-disulfide isomerase/thioredoxin
MKTIPIVLLVSALASAQSTPEARALLKASQEAFLNYKSYVIEQRIVVDMSGATQARMEMSAKLAASAPGKMRVESTSQAGGALIVSDGENTWVYIDLTKQYMKTPAATSPEGLVRSLVPGMGGVFDQLKSKDPYLSAKITGEEAVEVDGKKIDCFVVEATMDKIAMPGAMTMTGALMKMWIDKDSKLSLKTTVTATMQGGPAAATPMQMNMAMTVISKKLNEPVEESLFTFTPPEGAKEVKDFTAATPGRADLTGKVAADFKLKSLAGKEYSLQDLRGHVVLLDFWATWCGPCRKDLPMLEKLHQEFKDKGLVLLGFNVGEGREVVSKFLASAKLSYPMVLTAGTGTTQDYSVTAYPTVVLIDREGKIVVDHIGSGSEAELRAGLAKLGLESAK